MKLSTDAALHFTGKVGETLVGFATILYIAHALGASAVGTYALAVAVATWATLPVNAIANGISKRTSEHGDGGYITAGIGLAGLALIGILAVMTPLAGILTAYTGVDYSLVVGLTAALAIYPVCANMFIAREMVGHNGLINTADRILRLVATVGLVIVGWGVAGVILGHISGIVITWGVAVAYYWGRLRPQFPADVHAHGLLVYARHIWLDVLRTKAFNWTDTLVLGVFVSPALIGVYEVAWRLAKAVSLVAASVQRAVFPRISTVDDDGNGYARAKRLLEDSLPYPGIFALPAIIGALVLGDAVFLIYGRDFLVASAGLVLVLLLSAVLLGAYSRQFIGALNAVNRHGAAFRINALIIGANLLLNAVLVWRHGWIGAAVATLIAYGLSLVLGYDTLTSIVGRIDPPVRDLTDQVFAAIVMAAVVAGLTVVQPVATVPWLLVVVGVGAGIYGGILLVLNPTVRGTAESILDDLHPTLI